MTIFGKVFLSASLAKAMKADDDWQPLPGMAKATCRKCRKPFAYRLAEWEVPPTCCAPCGAYATRKKAPSSESPFDPGGGGSKPSRPKRLRGDGH